MSSVVQSGIERDIKRSVRAATIRAIFVRLHRYAGLALALFLTIAGLTGSVLAFNDELDAWLNPHLYRSSTTGEILPPSELAARITAIDSRLVPFWIPLSVAPGASAIVWVTTTHDPKTGEHYDLGFNQVFLDPTTGDVLGKRNWGALSLTRENLIPFLYVLHYSLHIPAGIGTWIMGIAAIVWIFDCFVGLYLTFPRGRPFFAKWKPAWLIKRGAGRHRVTFDVHRASGLWLWVMLLIVAVSAVYLNLPDQVFRPAVGSILQLTPEPEEGRVERENVAPSISFEEAITLAGTEAARIGFTRKPAFVGWDPDYLIYWVHYQDNQYRAGPGLDASTFYVAGDSGELLAKKIGGQGTPGDILVQLQFPLHSGEIAGLAGRIAVCLLGVLVAVLSVTGVLVWNRKWRAAMSAKSVQPN